MGGWAMRVRKGVVVEGVAVGGMTYAAAEACVREKLAHIPFVLHTPAGDAVPEIVYTDDLARLLRRAARGEELRVTLRRELPDAEQFVADVCEKNVLPPQDARLSFSRSGFSYTPERAGRRCRLTPAGEYFARRSRTILAEAAELRRETVRIGSDSELFLNIGYLSGYDGQELPRAVAAFSETYPEVVVSVFKGTHEELYRAILNGKANFLLSDQRRAFSDECENYILNQSPAYIDVAASHPLAGKRIVAAGELEKYPCIVVSDREEEETEGRYYGEYLGIGKQFLFAASLDEARLLAMSGRGALIVESANPLAEPPLVRLEVRRADGGRIMRTYCAFWQKKWSNYYLEEFASVLRSRFAAAK